MNKYLLIYLESRHALAVLGSTIDAAVRLGWHIRFRIDRSPKGDDIRQGDLARWDRVSRWSGPAWAGVTLGLAGDARAQVGVSHYADNLLKPPAIGQRVGYMSEWHMRQHALRYPAWPMTGSTVVGWTIADHRALPVWEPYVPRPMVLFTMKRRVPEPWRRSWRGRWWYYRRVQEARRMAANHDAPFIIKTRAKHGDPWWVGMMGKVVGEESVYPLTSMQLLAQARVAFHFNSGAGLEARLFPDCRVVNWVVPQPHLDTLPLQREVYAHHYHAPLNEVITYDDCLAGERVMEMVANV